MELQIKKLHKTKENSLNSDKAMSRLFQSSFLRYNRLFK